MSGRSIKEFLQNRPIYYKKIDYERFPRAYAAIKDKIPKISTDWLIFGKGEMYLEETGATNNTSSPEPLLDKQPQLNFDAPVAGPSLFNEQPAVAPKVVQAPREPERVEVKVIEKPQRKVTEIRIFYDDRTWESFYPESRDGRS